jgi:hypothetical protein
LQQHSQWLQHLLSLVTQRQQQWKHQLFLHLKQHHHLHQVGLFQRYY